MQLSACVCFDGVCEEALRFYEQCGLGRIVDLLRFEGSPMAQYMPADRRRRVMHAYLEGPGVGLHASDSMRSSGKGFSGFALSIGVPDLAEANGLFAVLSEGGKVTMPVEREFGAATFGKFTDRFGIDWMINCGARLITLV
jgi:PhnB protein